jgi:hypothetical protein
MNGLRSEYIQAAIQNEARRVASAVPGSRNDTLNKAAFNLASLGVPGSEIIHSLKPAALGCGLKNGEIYSTINSGMKAGKRHPRLAPATGQPRPASSTRFIPEGSLSNSLPNCDAAEKFVACEGGPPALKDELRRHVYRRSGRPVRVKIKLERDGGTHFQNWYAVIREGVSGWQAKKPADYIAVPYISSLDPFDKELAGDDLIWPEGEKDVDTLARLNIPAFTFGGTGDGLPVDVTNCLRGRRVVILADNDMADTYMQRKRRRLPTKLALRACVSFTFQN